MLSKSQAVTLTLLGLAQSHNKPYCYPSQEKIRNITEKVYQVSMSRRTLNRILKELVVEGMILRIRRHRKGSFGQLIFCSTLYKFTGKLFNWLFSWAKRFQRFFAFYRVPKWAQYKPKKESKVFIRGPSPIGPLVLDILKGRASPIGGVL